MKLERENEKNNREGWKTTAGYWRIDAGQTGMGNNYGKKELI